MTEPDEDHGDLSDMDEEACSCICNAAVGKWFHLILGLSFSASLFGVTIWALVVLSIAQEESVDVITTFALGLFLLVWKFTKEIVKKSDADQDQGFLPSQTFTLGRLNDHRRFFRFFHNTVSFSFGLACVTFRLLYEFNYFGTFQNSCYEYCCNCGPDTSPIDCRSVLDGKNQSCLPKYRIPCSKYSPWHRSWNFMYLLPVFWYCVFVLLVLYYSYSKDFGFFKTFLKNRQDQKKRGCLISPILWAYVVYSLVIKACFIALLYTLKLCDTPLLGFILLYMLLMIELKGDILKEVEAIQGVKGKGYIPAWLSFWMNFEMFVTLGSVVLVNTLDKAQWASDPNDAISLGKYGLIGFMVIAELVYSLSALLSKNLVDHCCSCVPSCVFYLTMIVSLGLTAVTIFSSVILSVSQEQSIQIVAIYCLAVFLLLWKFFKAFLKLRTDNVRIAERKKNIMKDRRTLKLFLNITLFTYFAVLTGFKYPYMTNYWGDYQDPCHPCCNCTQMLNLTRTPLLTDPNVGFCEIDKNTKLRQNCSKEFVIPCENYAPHHGLPYVKLLYLVPGILYVLLLVLIVIYYQAEGRSTKKKDGGCSLTTSRSLTKFCTAPNGQCNGFALWLMGSYFVILMALKIGYFLVFLHAKECDVGSLGFLLIYGLFIIDLKGDVSKEIDSGMENMKKSIRGAYLGGLLQVDVGLTLIVGVVMQILNQTKDTESPLEIRFWWGFFGTIIFCEILFWGATCLGGRTKTEKKENRLHNPASDTSDIFDTHPRPIPQNYENSQTPPSTPLLDEHTSSLSEDHIHIDGQ